MFENSWNFLADENNRTVVGSIAAAVAVAVYFFSKSTVQFFRKKPFSQTHANVAPMGQSAGGEAEAAFRRGLKSKRRGDFVSSKKSFSEAVRLAPDNALYLNEAGEMAQSLGQYDQAIGFLEKALDCNIKTHGDGHADVAIAWNNLGSAWHDKGEPDKAIEFYEKALAIDLKNFGPDHPDVAINWANLGEAWREKGRYDKTIEYHEKALTSDLKTYGPHHPDVARVWNNLGSAWHDKGEDDKAIEFYEKALASDLKNFGSHHPEVAVDFNNLGIAWDDKDQHEKAIEYYEKALAIFKKAGREEEAIEVEDNIQGLRK